MPTIYHASPVSKRDSIHSGGFQISKNGRCGPGAYFVFKKGQADRIGEKRFGRGNYDIWCCHVENDKYDVKKHPPWCKMSAFKEIVVRECGEISESRSLVHSGMNYKEAGIEGATMAATQERKKNEAQVFPTAGDAAVAATLSLGKVCVGAITSELATGLVPGTTTRTTCAGLAAACNMDGSNDEKVRAGVKAAGDAFLQDGLNKDYLKIKSKTDYGAAARVAARTTGAVVQAAISSEGLTEENCKAITMAAGKATATEVASAGLSEALGGAAPVPTDVIWDDQRVGLDFAGGGQIAVGQTEVHKHNSSGNTTKTVDEKHTGVQLVAPIPNTAGILTVSGNVGVSEIASKKETNRCLHMETKKDNIEVKGAAMKLQMVGIEICDISTGKVRTVCTTETKIGNEVLNVWCSNGTKTDGINVLGMRVWTFAKENTREIGASFCNLGICLGVSETDNWFCNNNTSRSVGMQFLFIEVTAATNEGVSFTVTDQGHALFGQGLSCFAKTFAGEMLRGATFNDAFQKGAVILKARMGIIAKDMFYTTLASGVCSMGERALLSLATSAGEANKSNLQKFTEKWFFENKWAKHVNKFAPLLGAPITAAIRPLVECFMAGEFSKEKFTNGYLRQLVLNVVVGLLKINGCDAIVALIEAAFSSIYDKWLTEQHEQQFDMMELLLDLLPAVVQLLLELGAVSMSSLGGPVAVFAVKYLLVPVLCEILQKENIEAFQQWVVSTELWKWAAEMKARFDDLEIGQKIGVLSVSVCGGAGAGALAASLTMEQTVFWVFTRTVPMFGPVGIGISVVLTGAALAVAAVKVFETWNEGTRMNEIEQKVESHQFREECRERTRRELGGA